MKCFGVEDAFIKKWMKKTGKRAFSIDYAAKNIPPEVVKQKSKKTQGQRVRWCV
jgi:hypothetical protein